jgi:hypothetical protein
MQQRSKRKQKPAPKPVEPDIRVVTIQDVEYFIEWSQLDVGHSFFLPTVATAKQVQTILKPFAEKLDYRFGVLTRCEYGRYGVRVWRLY